MRALSAALPGLTRRFRTSKTTVVSSYILSGKRTMKLSRFGMRTLGSDSAFIVSFSPISLFWARIHAVSAYTSSSVSERGAWKGIARRMKSKIVVEVPQKFAMVFCAPIWLSGAGFVPGAALQHYRAAVPAPGHAKARERLRQHRLLQLRRRPAPAAVGGHQHFRDAAVARIGDAGNLIQARTAQPEPRRRVGDVRTHCLQEV